MITKVTLMDRETRGEIADDFDHVLWRCFVQVRNCIEVITTGDKVVTVIHFYFGYN